MGTDRCIRFLSGDRFGPGTRVLGTRVLFALGLFFVLLALGITRTPCPPPPAPRGGLPETAAKGRDGGPLPMLEPVQRSDGSWSPGFCRDVEAGVPLASSTEERERPPNVDDLRSDFSPFSEPLLRQAQFGEIVKFRDKWATQSIPELLSLRYAWQRHLRTTALPYSKASELFNITKGSRGIVTTMEGRTLAHALTGLLVLRSLGCTLDIEAWHYRGELTEGQRQLAERVLSSEKGGKLRVREIEGEAERVYALGHREPFFYLPKRTDRRNYQIKIEAIMASSFEQVISLDSDNVPTMDPTFLFSEPEYLASSALFFPNFWRPAPDHPMWTISNLPWRFGWELETGQLVISKPKAWCGISLSLFFLQSDAYQPQYIFGDHDAFYYGLLAANIFFNIVKWPLAVGGLRSIPTPPATVAKATEFCGLVMVQNHPQRRNVSLFYHTHSLKYGALYGQAYRADNETVAGKGPFPHVLRYGAATDPVKMRGLGYHNSAGVWCASLGGEGEAGVEMEWSDTDVAFTRRWQEARFKADTLLFG